MNRTVPPVLPEWLIDAAQRLGPVERGVAIGYAAAGFVAGHDEGFGAGFDSAMEAVRGLSDAVDQARAATGCPHCGREEHGFICQGSMKSTATTQGVVDAAP